MEFNNQTECLNCHQPLTSDYCGHCGQEKVARISFRQLILIIQRGLFEFKSPFFNNLIGLTIRPAQTCREYIEGKRVKYFNPVKYSFWLLTASLILATLLGVDMVSASFDSFKSSGDATFIDSEIENALRNGIVYYFFVITFIVALVVRAFFPKNKYNLWELYLTLLMVSGHLTLLTIALLLMGVYTLPEVQWGYTLVSLIFPIIVIARMYLPVKKLNYVKAILAVIIGSTLGTMSVGFVAGVQSGFNHQHKLDQIENVPNETEQPAAKEEAMVSTDSLNEGSSN